MKYPRIFTIAVKGDGKYCSEYCQGLCASGIGESACSVFGVKGLKEMAGDTGLVSFKRCDECVKRIRGLRK